MQSLTIILSYIFPNTLFAFRYRLIGFGINLLILQCSPEPFYEDIVDHAAFTVHADFNLFLLEDRGEIPACELRALVRVEILWVSSFQGLPQSLTAEIRFQSVANFPGDDITAVKIHHGHQVYESMLQPDVREIGCPCDVGPVNGHIPEKIGIDLMLLVRKAQSPPGINRLHPEYPHQTPGFMPANFKSPTLQLPAHPTTPINREIQVDIIHFIKNSLILLRQPDPFIIETRPVERKNLTLPPHTQLPMIFLHKLPLYRFWICSYFFFRNSSSIFCCLIFLYSSSVSFLSSSISGSFFLEKRLETFSKSCFFHLVI